MRPGHGRVDHLAEALDAEGFEQNPLNAAGAQFCQNGFPTLPGDRDDRQPGLFLF